MRICVNGIFREMTPEEEANFKAHEHEIPVPEDDPFEIIDVLTGEA